MYNFIHEFIPGEAVFLFPLLWVLWREKHPRKETS